MIYLSKHFIQMWCRQLLLKGVIIFYKNHVKFFGDVIVSLQISLNLIGVRSSPSHMFFKIGVLKNFANFTGKHLCWSLFLIELQVWRPYWKQTPTLVFSGEICETLKNIYFTEHLRWLLLWCFLLTQHGLQIWRI